MEKRTVLLTGARAPAALEWARQFDQAGWRVLAADSMPRPLASWSRAVSKTWRVPAARHDPDGFVHAVAEICRDQNVEFILPVCEEIFELSRGRERLPQGTRLWAEPLDRLRALHDKHAFIAWAERLGLPTPETRLLTSSEEVRKLTGDWFLKPCFSRFAVQGRRWSEGTGQVAAEADTWLARQLISRSRPWVAQAFLAGQGWCVYALAEAGRVLSLVCYPVVWTAGAGACVAFTAQRHADVEAWVQRFIQAAVLTGQMAFDLIDVPGRGVLPLECNPRATSGIHLLPQGAQILVRAIDRKRNLNEVNPTSMPTAGTGSAMLRVPMLLYGLPQAICQGTATDWLQTWRSSREATSAPGDAASAWLGNLWTLAWFAMQARRLQCGLTEATTADLEWNGDFTMSSSPE